MAINTREYTFIGSTYQEIVRAFFSAIGSYNNITAEGVTASSTNCYEYFTIEDHLNDNLTYRICLNAYDSGYTMRSGPARSSHTGGNMVSYIDINSGSNTKYKSFGGKLYSHCRMFYDGSNNFIGSTGLYGDNYNPVLWFGIFHDDKNTPFYYMVNTSAMSGANNLYDMTYNPPSASGITIVEDETSSENELSLNNETSDTVYLDRQCYYTYSTNNVEGYLPDVYTLYNNSFYRLVNGKRNVNTLLLVNTEKGQYMGLRPSTWLKIGKVGEHKVVIYNG